MTREQREVLFNKWDLCGSARKKEIITEYFAKGGAFCQSSWEIYLKKKLQVEEYREPIGLM